MKLRDLDARFLGGYAAGRSRYVATLADADGVVFQCPACAVGKERGAEGGRHYVVGAHYVICWFTGRVPDDALPGPGRWDPAGTSIDDLTFVGPGATSVQLHGGCGWHGHVSGGEAN